MPATFAEPYLSSPIIIPAGSNSLTLYVVGQDTGSLNAEEAFVIDLAACQSLDPVFDNLDPENPSGSNLYFNNNNGAAVTFTRTFDDVDEGLSLDIVVLRSGGIEKAANVGYSISTDVTTATEGADFTLLPAPGNNAIAFKKGDAEAHITLSGIDDLLDEGVEFVKLELFGGGGQVATGGPILIRINDDDAPLALQNIQLKASQNQKFTLLLEPANNYRGRFVRPAVSILNAPEGMILRYQSDQDSWLLEWIPNSDQFGLYQLQILFTWPDDSRELIHADILLDGLEKPSR